MKRIYLLLGAVLIVMLSLMPIHAFAATATYTFHQIDMSGVFNSDAYTVDENYTTGTYYHKNPGRTYNDPLYGNVPMDMREAGEPNVWLSHGLYRTATFPRTMTLYPNIENAAIIWLVGFDAGWSGDANAPVEVKYKLDGVDTTVTYTPNDWTWDGTGDENLVLWVDHNTITGSAQGDISVARIVLPHTGYLAEITVTDPDTVYWPTSFPIFAVTVAEAIIPVDAGPDTTINEGDTFTSTGSFTDPDGETWTATVDYGDGSGEQPLDLLDKTFSLSHLYADNGTYTVTVTVTNNQGDIGSDSATVVVNNVAPIVDAGPDDTIDEGDTFSNTVGYFTDPGADTWTATVDYGDGTGVQALALTDKTFSLSHKYTDNGVYTVTVTVTDDDGGTGTDTATVTVNNVAPILDAGSDATIDEGSTFNSSGSFTDPGADIWTATVDYGDGSGVQALVLSGKTFSLSHTYADDGDYMVTVTVTDDDGGEGSDTLIVTVNNVAPTVEVGEDKTIYEGDTFSSSGSFIDPGADIWTATVDYGDGTGVQPLTLSGKTFSLSHEYYADDGQYTVTVTVTDDDGGVGSDTLIVSVNNVAPTVEAGANQTVYAGDTVNFAGSFTDPGWPDTHTATWNFGDGNSGTGTVTEENVKPDSTGTVTGSYIFYNKGTYIVTLQVTDDDGGVGTDTLEVTVLAIPAIIDFEPETLNLKSEGKWVTVFIELPAGPDGQDWDIHEIDAASVALNGVPAVVDPQYGFVKNSAAEDNNGNNRLMLKFDRDLVQATLEIGENVEIYITGKVMYNDDLADFEGTDYIRVISNGKNESGAGMGIGKNEAPGQNKEPGDNADGKAIGKEDAPGQNKEPGDNADGKAIGKEDAPGQNKDYGDNADGKAIGKDEAPGQNK